jgi:hypothetical protein
MPVGTVYAQSEIDPILNAVCTHWISKIRMSYDYKRRIFSDTADECMQFYNGPRSWDELMGSQLGTGGVSAEEGFPSPDFKVVVNKTFEFVTLFGPTLYYENPIRVARPRAPIQVPVELFPNPAMFYPIAVQEDRNVRLNGLRGVCLETYLNYLPYEFGLAQESRCSIEEALIKGRGCMWTELYQPPGTTWKVVRSYYDSVDHLFVDPDSMSFEHAMWIAKRCIQPVWQVERDFGLRRGSLRGNYESMAQQAAVMLDENLQYDRRRGFTNDLLVFYKIWSKMGMGGRLAGINQAYRGPLEMFGDYCYLVVAENTPFPLNLSPDVVNVPGFASDPSQVFARTAWPTPFWAIGRDEWPVSNLDFHPIPNTAWPMAHLKSAMGELKFLNWLASFLMGRVRTSCRDFLVVRKSLSEEFKDTILRGGDLALIELDSDMPGKVEELVQFLAHPQVNGDVFRLMEIVNTMFDKRTGLNELMYGGGGTTQIRSASEIQLRSESSSVRPDDMARVTEDWMSRVAVKEAMCARYHLRGADVSPILGTVGSILWDTFVATVDLQEASRQLEYRIEAGSSRKPNKEFESRTMDTMFQAVAPFLQTYAQATGDCGPINNLIADLAKSRALDPNRYVVKMAPPPPPQPPPQPGEPAAGPEQEPAAAPPTNGQPAAVGA